MTDQSTSRQSPTTSTNDSEPAQTAPTAPTASTAPTREGTHGDSVRVEKKPAAVMGWVRIVAGLVLAGVALLVWFDAAPSDTTFADERSSIEATDDGNNLLAEGAPQQEVVNGWTTIEYLNLLSKQQELSDNRLDALLLLALLGGSVALVTSRSNART